MYIDFNDPYKENVKLSNSTGRFTTSYHSELKAIELALDKVLEAANIGENWNSILICTDSQSAVTSLMQGHAAQKEPTNHKIWNLLHVITNSCRVHIQWVPGHAGLQGNEIVDSLAKQGSSDDQTAPSINLKAAQSRIARHVRETWLSDYKSKCLDPDSSNSTCKWHYQVTSGCPPKLSKNKIARKEARIIEQLRMGKSPILRKTRYEFGLEPSSICTSCTEGTPEDAKHLLIDCAAWTTHRLNLFGPFPKPPDIFESCAKVIIFLKRIGRLGREDGLA